MWLQDTISPFTRRHVAARALSNVLVPSPLPRDKGRGAPYRTAASGGAWRRTPLSTPPSPSPRVGAGGPCCPCCLSSRSGLLRNLLKVSNITETNCTKSKSLHASKRYWRKQDQTSHPISQRPNLTSSKPYVTDLIVPIVRD